MPRHLSAANIYLFHDITKYLPNYFIHTPLKVIFPPSFLATAIITIHEKFVVNYMVIPVYENSLTSN